MISLGQPIRKLLNRIKQYKAKKRFIKIGKIMAQNYLTQEHLDTLTAELMYTNTVLANASNRYAYFVRNFGTERQQLDAAINSIRTRKMELELQIDAIANSIK